MTTAEQISQECDAIKGMLLEKNARYGDSAMHPRRIFSRADHLEQLKVRIDDKLSRIATMGTDDADEDTVGDLIGYLVLLRVAGRTVKDHLTVEPWKSAIPEQDVERRERAATGSPDMGKVAEACGLKKVDCEGISFSLDAEKLAPGKLYHVPDKTSRANLEPDVACTACGHRFFSVSENGRRILETGVCFACKDLVADGPPVQIPPETVLPLKQMPDECLGALCGRARG